ncbi:6767_t:CDS:2, partial [Racocetra persica]
KERIRATQACKACKVKKTKCSGHTGPKPCAKCQQRGSECVFEAIIPRRGPDPKKRNLNIQKDGGDKVSPSNSDYGPLVFDYEKDPSYISTPPSPIPPGYSSSMASSPREFSSTPVNGFQDLPFEPYHDDPE